MAAGGTAYRKLPGRSSGLVERRFLYLADDHVLSVETAGYTEHYRRFDLADIQAVTARVTAAHGVYLSVFCIGLIFCLVPVVFVDSLTARVFLVLGAIGTGLGLLANLIRGPTCETTLYTSVSRKRLHSLGRIRTFRRVMSILAPLIDERQGRLDPALLREIPAPPPDESAAAIPAPVPPPIAGRPRGGAVLGLSLGLLSDAAASGLMLAFDAPALSVLKFAAMLLMTIMIVVGFAGVPDRPACRGLRMMVWTGLGYVTCMYFLLYILYIVSSIDSPLPTIDAFSSILPSSSPVAYWSHVASLVVSLILGTAGFLTCLRFRGGAVR